MPVIALQDVFVFFSQAMGLGIAMGVILDLLAYGIIKALSLINIKF